jgi:hypothetical protein
MPGEGAAAAAAAKRKRDLQQEEEEEVTPLNSDPSGAVEYKIIRSVSGGFKKPAKLRAALEEEARAGWELMEKLDNSRVRLRRPVAWRQKDGELAQDPYRINVGMSEPVFGLWIALVALAGAAVMIGLVLGILTLVLPK